MKWPVYRRPRKLTDTEIARIRSLKSAGLPRKQIRQITGHSYKTIKKYCRGVKPLVRYSKSGWKQPRLRRSRGLTFNQTLQLIKLLHKLKVSSNPPNGEAS